MSSIPMSAKPHDLSLAVFKRHAAESPSLPYSPDSRAVESRVNNDDVLVELAKRDPLVPEPPDFASCHNHCDKIVFDSNASNGSTSFLSTAVQTEAEGVKQNEARMCLNTCGSNPFFANGSKLHRTNNTWKDSEEPPASLSNIDLDLESSLEKFNRLFPPDVDELFNNANIVLPESVSGKRCPCALNPTCQSVSSVEKNVKPSNVVCQSEHAIDESPVSSTIRGPILWDASNDATKRQSEATANFESSLDVENPRSESTDLMNSVGNKCASSGSPSDSATEKQKNTIFENKGDALFNDGFQRTNEADQRLRSSDEKPMNSECPSDVATERLSNSIAESEMKKSDSWGPTPLKVDCRQSLSREDTLSDSSSSLLSVESLAQLDSLLQWLARGSYLSSLGESTRVARPERRSMRTRYPKRPSRLPRSRSVTELEVDPSREVSADERQQDTIAKQEEAPLGHGLQSTENIWTKRNASLARRHSFSCLEGSNDCEGDIDWSWLDTLTDPPKNHGGISAMLTPNRDRQAKVTCFLHNPESQHAHITVECSAATPAAPSAPPIIRREGNSTWLRESMRRVRPFRLSEPPPSAPLPSSPVRVVDDRNEPLFPCEIMERPTSAPVERPRQYGRRCRPSGAASFEPPGSSEGLRPRPLECVRSQFPDSVGVEQLQVAPTAPSAPLCEELSASFSSGDSSSDSEEHVTLPEQHLDPLSVIRAYEMPQVSISPQGQWSHGLSSLLASLGCTLGLFNISRFAILSVHFGANFIIQFAILSLLVGVPLFTFHVSLGQLLASGVIDMWTISPVFKGIGVALLISQAMLGTYSIIGVSWMFVYFRDSFITKQDVYRWAEALDLSRDDGLPDFRRTNVSYKLEETVPDYFSGVVLQRQYLVSPPSDSGSIKFSVAFNLAVAWLIIFISLSKGLKSYGKVIYVFSVVPVVGLFVLCAKMLGAAPGMSQNQDFFLETDWSEFFLNTKSWTAAFVESFATWGMLGASAMQIASHNKQKNLLPRDTGLVIIITLAVLILSSFLAHTCYQLILAHGFLYSPSSFEKMSTYRFLYLRNSPQPSFPPKLQWMAHSGLFMGERVINPSRNPRHESGYQALRFATELVPATFALLGADKVSPFWSVLFYFVLTLFGIAQQLAIWHCVVSGIVAIDAKSLKPWLTTITFFSCLFAFIIGLPLTSELGIFVIYYIDYCVGSGWWLVLLYLLEIGAVFMVRGRPYSGETVVATLFSHTSQLLQSWIAPLLSFIWNVILPVALMLLSTTIIKNGGYKILYNWQIPGYDYWPPWGRQAGCLIQLVPLVIVPIVGIIQTCRYLTAGPPDIFERIQLLYRPRIDPQQNIHDMSVQANLENGNGHSSGVPVEDPPPKYTPPPSYSTATGARIAKLFRQSLRRSVRGIRHIRSVLGTGENRDAYDVANPPGSPRRPPPPNYAAVLVEINQNQTQGNGSSNRTQVTIPRRENEVHEIIRRSFSSSDANGQSGSGTMTASDVANILRSSLRRQVLRSNSMSSQVSSSVEHLVRNAVPINQDSLVFDNENMKENSQQNTIN